MMLSFLFTQQAVSLRGVKNGTHSFDLFDYSSTNKSEISIIKNVQIRFAQVDVTTKNKKDIKTLDEMKDILEHSVEVENYGDKYVVIKQTIKNIAKTPQRIDLSTSMRFDEKDKDVEAYYIPNFGVYMDFQLTNAKTLVFWNHPLVTNIQELSWGKNTQTYFTDSISRLKEGEQMNTYWFTLSWTRHTFEPNEAKTFSFLMHDDDYEPPLLTLEKSLIREEYFNNESIHVKGNYSTRLDYGLDLSIKYKIVNSNNDSVYAEGVLDKNTTSAGKTSFSFDKTIEPIKAPGSYILHIISSNDEFDYTFAYTFPIIVEYATAKPRIQIVGEKKVYYIPNTDCTISAYITDADAEDQSLDTRIFFDGKQVFAQNLENAHVERQLTFRIPADATVGKHEVKITATDGKRIGMNTFTIILRDNNQTTIEFEGEFKPLYYKGDQINFTAYIVDPDYETDSNFKVSLLYGEKLKTSHHVDNPKGEMRVPFSFTVPTDEKNNTAIFSVKAEGKYESFTKSHAISIYQDPTTNEKASEQIAKKEQAKKNALVAVLSVFVVLSVIVAIVIVILWFRK